MHSALFLALLEGGCAGYKDKDDIGVFGNLLFRGDKSKMQINRDRAEYVSTIRKVQSLMKIKKKYVCLLRRMTFHAQCLLNTAFMMESLGRYFSRWKWKKGILVSELQRQKSMEAFSGTTGCSWTRTNGAVRVCGQSSENLINQDRCFVWEAIKVILVLHLGQVTWTRKSRDQ